MPPVAESSTPNLAPREQGSYTRQKSAGNWSFQPRISRISTDGAPHCPFTFSSSSVIIGEIRGQNSFLLPHVGTLPPLTAICGPLATFSPPLTVRSRQIAVRGRATFARGRQTPVRRRRIAVRGRRTVVRGRESGMCGRATPARGRETPVRNRRKAAGSRETPAPQTLSRPPILRRTGCFRVPKHTTGDPVRSVSTAHPCLFAFQKAKVSVTNPQPPHPQRLAEALFPSLTDIASAISCPH